MVATINLANNSKKLLTQPWACAACHTPRKSFLLFVFKCWQLWHHSLRSHYVFDVTYLFLFRTGYVHFCCLVHRFLLWPSSNICRVFCPRFAFSELLQE